MSILQSLIAAVVSEDYVSANKQFSTIIAEKMKVAMDDAYKTVAQEFAKEQAPPQQDSYAEEVSTAEPSSSSNMEQHDTEHSRVRDVIDAEEE